MSTPTQEKPKWKRKRQQAAYDKRNPLKEGPPRKRGTTTEVEQLTEIVEAAMIRRMPETAITRLMLREHNLSIRQTYRYILKVRERWAAEASTTEREARRHHMRKSLDDAYAKAMTSSKTKPDPDVSSALRAAKLLMELDALAAAPLPQHHSVQATVVAAVAKAKPTDLAAFLTRLPAVAPPGDEGT